MFIMGTGRPDAPIMIVGESLSSEDVRLGQPFMGRTGEILNQLLRDADIFRADCYLTTVFNAFPDKGFVESYVHKNRKSYQPTDVRIRNHPCEPVFGDACRQLFDEIDLVKPKVIVAMGEVAMWVLTGAEGINKWRGSVMEARDLNSTTLPVPVIPLLPISDLFHSPEHKAVMINDLKRAVTWSTREDRHLPGHQWKIITRPDYRQAWGILDTLQRRLNREKGLEPLEWIEFDLETRAGHIACAGVSWSATEALCVPFMCAEDFNGYWPADMEIGLIKKFYQVLTHPRVKVCGQNLLYDCQYTHLWWGWVPRVGLDTMIAHHTCFAALPRGLDYEASLYCDDYVYWKDDGKTWARDVSEDQLWRYNGVDCIRTHEVREAVTGVLQTLDLTEVDRFQQALFWPVLYAMCRGVRVDLEGKKKIVKQLKSEIETGQKWIDDVLGHPLNIGSPKQMVELFYTDFGCQKVFQKKGPRRNVGVTCDEDALNLIAKREPLVKPFVEEILKLRSTKTLCGTFAESKLGYDGRMRCSYDICGTHTYRFNSRKDAFESGMNLQNIPPQLRWMFIPDEGMVMFDTDLSRADFYVVVWEADEPELKAAMRKGVDMHTLNALTLAGVEVDLDELIEGTETCTKWAADYAKQRKLAKGFIHGTNYGGGARTMATQAGITVAEAEKFQKMYFEKYPGIKEWHARVEYMLTKQRCVKNILGYRIDFFGDTSRALPEALAWQPQSTVGCVINRIWMNLWMNLPEVEVLMQVHDSLVGQVPIEHKERVEKAIKAQSSIVLGYEEPLVIPAGIKWSEKSWGDCK